MYGLVFCAIFGMFLVFIGVHVDEYRSNNIKDCRFVETVDSRVNNNVENSIKKENEDSADEIIVYKDKDGNTLRKEKVVVIEE